MLKSPEAKQRKLRVLPFNQCFIEFTTTSVYDFTSSLAKLYSVFLNHSRGYNCHLVTSECMQLDHNVDHSQFMQFGLLHTLQSKLLPDSISLHVIWGHTLRPLASVCNCASHTKKPIYTLYTKLLGFSQLFLFCLPWLSSKCLIPLNVAWIRT